MEYLSLSLTQDNAEMFTGKAFVGLTRMRFTIGSVVLDSQTQPTVVVIPTISATVEPASINVTLKLAGTGLNPGIFAGSFVEAYQGSTLLWTESRNFIVPGFLTVGTNSYATLAEADAYHSAKFNSEDWFAYSIGTRERAMVGACNLLETMRWIGERPRVTQTLQWPRVIRNLRTFGQSFSYDMDLNVLGIEETPINIKNGQAELAYQLLKGFMANSSVSSLRIGPIQIAAQNNGPLPLDVKNLVGSYIDNQVRLTRT